MPRPGEPPHEPVPPQSGETPVRHCEASVLRGGPKQSRGSASGALGNRHLGLTAGYAASMPKRDQLFLLTSDFTDTRQGDRPFFCPETALIEGMLAFYPKLRSQVDIHYIGFDKPRTAIVALLGAAQCWSWVRKAGSRSRLVPTSGSANRRDRHTSRRASRSAANPAHRHGVRPGRRVGVHRTRSAHPANALRACVCPHRKGRARAPHSREQ